MVLFDVANEGQALSFGFTVIAWMTFLDVYSPVGAE